ARHFRNLRRIAPLQISRETRRSPQQWIPPPQPLNLCRTAPTGGSNKLRRESRQASPPACLSRKENQSRGQTLFLAARGPGSTPAASSPLLLLARAKSGRRPRT